MLATLAEAPLVDPNLVYEPKYDGIRALVSVVPAKGSRARFPSPRGGETTRPGSSPRSSRRSRAGGSGAGRRRCSTARSSRSTTRATRSGSSGCRSGSTRPRRARWRAWRASGRSRSSPSICCATAPTIWPACRSLERRARLEAALAGGLDSTLRIARQVRGDGTALMDEAQAAGLGGDRRQGRPVDLQAGAAHARLAEAEAGQAAGAGDRRLHRAARRRALTSARCCSGCRPTAASSRYAGHVGGGFTEKELGARRAPAWRRARSPTSPFDGPLPAANEQAALGPPGAGRRGAVRRVDERGPVCGSRSTSGCATISCRRR